MECLVVTLHVDMDMDIDVDGSLFAACCCSFFMLITSKTCPLNAPIWCKHDIGLRFKVDENATYLIGPAVSLHMPCLHKSIFHAPSK